MTHFSQDRSVALLFPIDEALIDFEPMGLTPDLHAADVRALVTTLK